MILEAEAIVPWGWGMGLFVHKDGEEKWGHWPEDGAANPWAWRFNPWIRTMDQWREFLILKTGQLILGDGAIASWGGGILVHVGGATVQWG